MILALRVIGSAVRQIWSHTSVAGGANVVAMVLSVPLLILIGVGSYLVRSFGLIPVGFALLVAILPNPVTAGVQAVMHDMARGDVAYFSEQWRGLRELWRGALRAWIFSVAVTAVILLNLLFYLRASFGFSGVLELLWLYLLLLWLALHLYVYPLMLEQEDQRLRVVYRNALVLSVSRPIFTVSLAVMWIALLLLLSSTGLATVIGLSLGSGIQQNALVRLLPEFQRPPAPEATV